jgi:hypothetical protein
MDYPTLFTTVDDELYDEVCELSGQQVVYVEVWEDSLSAELSGERERAGQEGQFDLDLYLAAGAYFELYGVSCYRSLEDDPLPELALVDKAVRGEIKQGLWLEEVAVDEDDLLVLVLGRQEQPRLYLQIGGWLIEEWDELPDG